MPKIPKNQDYQKPIFREKKSLIERASLFFGIKAFSTRTAERPETFSSLPETPPESPSLMNSSLYFEDLNTTVNRFPFNKTLKEALTKNQNFKIIQNKLIERKKDLNFLNDIKWGELFEHSGLSYYVGELYTEDALTFASNFIASSINSMMIVANERGNMNEKEYLVKTVNLAIDGIPEQKQNKKIQDVDLFTVCLNKAAKKSPPKSLQITDYKSTSTDLFLSTLLENPTIKKINGINRQVFLDHNNSVGYKFYLPTQNISEESLKPEDELRINDIYKNNNFYAGKYAEFGKVEMITIVDDIYSKNNTAYKAIKFPLIKNTRQLLPNEKIPEDWLMKFDQLGFGSMDIKPQNFIYVTQPNGTLDLLPVDAKFIGLTPSNIEFQRVLTKRTMDLQRTARGAYDELDVEGKSNNEFLVSKDKNKGHFIGENKNRINLP